MILMINNCFYSILALRFDDGSLKNLEDFLTKANSCIKEANPGNSIIAAIQSNNLTDIGAGYPRKWNASVQKLTEQLDKKNFQSSFLTSNFRNSSEVYESVKSMKANAELNVEIQEALKVAKKGTSLSSSNPEMFYFNWNIGHVNQQDLNKAVEVGIQKIKDMMKESETESYLLVFDDGIFLWNEIREAIQQNADKANFKSYPCEDETNLQRELDEFLIDPQNSCLVTTAKLMKGAETENSIMVLSQKSATNNLRGTLLRSVSNLVILIGLTEYDQFQFEGLKTNSDSLHCMIDCGLYMYQSKTYLTTTKRMKRICYACLMKCHVGNKDKFEWLYVDSLKKEDRKCECERHE